MQILWIHSFQKWPKSLKRFDIDRDSYGLIFLKLFLITYDLQIKTVTKIRLDGTKCEIHFKQTWLKMGKSSNGQKYQTTGAVWGIVKCCGASFFRPIPLIVFIRRDCCSQSSFSILRILTILSRIIFAFPGFHFSPFFFHPCCLSSLVTGDKVISASSFVKTRFKCKYNRNLKL